MGTALVVGGDYIDGIKQVLISHGVDEINHWPGRKVGDSKKVIPHDTKLIVLITDWVSHSFTHKIKKNAAKRGVRVIYTPNGPTALKSRLARLEAGSGDQEAGCRSETSLGKFFHLWLAKPQKALLPV
ncbi:MAG TPA: DUF2325 domain-containing protein [Methylophilaceae bacterium]